MYRLLFLNGKLKGKRMTVQQGDLLIGRGPDCHIQLDDDERVALRHAVIEIRKGRARIRDAGPMNRIEVNRRPVVEHRLRHGDRIEIGATAMEFHAANKASPPSQPRRFSSTQAAAFIAIALVVLLQVSFVIIFPLWQKREPAQPEKVSQPAEGNPPVLSLADGQKDITQAGPPIAPQPIVPAPVEREAGTPAAAAVADPLHDTAKNMLHDARKQIGLMNYVQADNTLHRAQLLAPDFTPLWEERAALYEKRRMYSEAIQQWEEVMELTGATPQYEKARRERDRVGSLQAALNVAEEPATIDEAREVMQAAMKNDRAIRIVSVDRQRFRESAEYDEMRVLSITLRRNNDQSPVVAGDVRITVEFFDRVEGTERIVPTRANTEDSGLQMVGAWPAGEAKTVMASYVLKKGFRAAEKNKLGENRIYEGYRIRVYYKDALQDEAVMPRRLAVSG